MPLTPFRCKERTAPIPRRVSRSGRVLLGASARTLHTSNRTEKAQRRGACQPLSTSYAHSNDAPLRCWKVSIALRRNVEMGTWLIGLSLVATGFLMGMVLMAILMATRRTDLQ